MNAGRNDGVILRVQKLCVLKKRAEILHQIELDFQQGEIHAIVGDHNAGKSLLAEVISGATKYHSGELVYQNNTLRGYTSVKARKLGITAVHQNPTIFGHFSVLDNIFLKSLVKSGSRKERLIMTGRAQQKLRSFGVDVDLRTPVRRCSESESLVVYLVRGLCTSSKILVVDEIGARLSPAQMETLRSELSLMRERGVTVIYFTSNVEEVYHFANRVSFLQKGRILATEVASSLGKLELVQLSYSHLYSRKELERSNYELFYLKNYYENIINSMPTPLLLLNSQATIIYVNDRFATTYAIEKEKYVGKEAVDLFRPGSEEYEYFRIKMSDNRQMKRFQNTVLATVDSPESSNLYAIPIYDEESSFLGSILFFDAMSIRVDLEQYNKNIQAYRRVPLFAHEIRNPLAILSNFITLIKNKSFSQEMKDYLSRSETEIKRINRIISNLMKEQGIGGDRLTASGTKFWLLAEEIKTLLLPMTNESQISIQNNTRRDIVLHYDEDEFKEILINLVLNAVEATGSHGNIAIDGDLEILDGKSYAVIKVEDNGKGIAPDHLRMVFEPFFSTKSGTERRGLGLSICKDIVDAWGGMITVESIVDIGTTVRVFLPE
jgi:nitrogen-specific signal transduction histidine kinase/ABC-type branched-subunit amino acid transport system ATPase component